MFLFCFSLSTLLAETSQDFKLNRICFAVRIEGGAGAKYVKTVSEINVTSIYKVAS